MHTDLGVGFIWFLAFLFSTTVHEAMHAFVAWKGGDSTAYLGGQVSLSPLPHIRREPIGMLVVPLLTSLTQGWAMGWASAPYDPYWAEQYPRRAAVMAAAGPAGNLLVGLAAFAIIKGGLATGYFIAPDAVNLETLVVRASSGTAGFVETALSVLLVLNVFLAAFNLLPLPPLDGGAVVTIVLPESTAATVRSLLSNGALSMVGLLIAWRVFPMLTGPLFEIVLRLVHPSFSYS